MIRTIAASFALTAAMAVPALAQELDLSGVSTAVGVAQTAGLGEAITSAGALTVFVPTNDALGAAPQDALGTLTGDPEKLSQVIQYYAVAQTITASDAVSMIEEAGGTLMVDTLGGTQLTLKLVDGNVVLEGGTGATATVVTPDITIGNATLHVIDGAILPSADVLN